MVRSQITPLDADWFVSQHICLFPIHSRHSQTKVWSERLKKIGASTTRITHQIHVTRPKFRGEIHLFDRLQFTHHLSDFHQKKKEGGQEREIRKEPEDQAGAQRKNRSPPGLENGEIVDVQVTEEGEIFDTDVFLDELAQQWRLVPTSTPQTSTRPFRNPSPPPPQGSTEILYSCPVHPNDTLHKKETDTYFGHWEYYKCPVQNCFVSCGVDNIEYYLESAKCQLHNFYLAKPMHVMKCYCHRPLIVSKFQSERNPGRLYLKCPKRWCDFFQWVDEEPRGKTKAWLEGGRVQERYLRFKELFIPRQRDIQRKKQHAEK